MTRPAATRSRRRALSRSLAAAALGMMVSAAPAVAGASDSSATINLIKLLIAKGILTQDQAADLLRQAQAEAQPARKPAQAKAAPGAAVAAVPPPLEAEPPPPPPGSVRVTYVPPLVRQQIAQEVRQQMIEDAKNGGFATPASASPLPDWVNRLRFYGDVRIRGERDLEGPNVDTNGIPTFIPDYNSINSGSGFDTTNGGLPPSINTTEDRTRFRLRARLGVRADLDDWVSTDIRIATGNDASPVSTNQTLGSPGNFSKYGIWLDRAYVLMEPLKPIKSIAPYYSMKMYVGRAPNPFWVSDLEYDEDVNFDGAALQLRHKLNGALDLFANMGAFTLFNSDFNFSSLNENKFPSSDKYLFAGQLGAEVKPIPSVTTRLAAGLFGYSGVQGKFSSPCTIVQTGIGCDTDATRADFLQFGNTLFGIRNIVTTATNTNTPEFFGLASRFNVLDLHGQVTYGGDRLPIPVSLEGEYSKNLAFNRKAISATGPVNNLNGSNQFSGGDTAYMIKVMVGPPEVSKLWEWNTSLAYKYLESDSVLDALTDSDFHLGGTNAKGFVLGANLGLARNLWLSAKWLSATQISGQPYSNDVVQLDLNARF